MSYGWLAPALARAQEETAADKNPAVSVAAGELFDSLRAWSMSATVSPQAQVSLQARVDTLAKHVGPAPVAGTFSTELLDLARRALEKA